MLKQKLFLRFDCFLDDPDAPEPQFEVICASITEALSEPYEIKVTLSSPNLNLIPKAFIKQPGSLILNFGHHKRCFHGLIGVFKQLQLSSTPEGGLISLYEVRLYPQLWFLKFNKDYRIFQNQSTLDIVSGLLAENGLLHVSVPKILGTSIAEHADPVRPYCVQYGESDFDFISRLLEERGFYYFFDHKAFQHYLRISFTPQDHHFCPAVDTIEILDTNFKGNELNKILTYEISSSMQPQHHVLIDYNYSMASLEMAAHVPSIGEGGVVYEYPATVEQLSDGHTKAIHLTEGEETGAITLAGTSCAPFFSPGFKFTLSGHQNVLFDEKVFTLQTVTHTIIDPRKAKHGDLLYTNSFSAYLSEVNYRPERKTPKPRIHGAQTALVISPGGEEVWTDGQGRVKVQFHWNHRGFKTPIIINNFEEISEGGRHRKRKQSGLSEDQEDIIRHTKHHKKHKHKQQAQPQASSAVLNEEDA